MDRPPSKKLLVKEQASDSDKFHTILHEIAHMFAHSKEEFEKQGINRFRPLIETEAETIAYVVAEYLLSRYIMLFSRLYNKLE